MNKVIYQVKGMHCSACELVIERKIKDLKGIKSVDAIASKENVTIEYLDQAPTVNQLNRLFKEDNYVFSEEETTDSKSAWQPVGWGILAVLIFVIIEKLGFSNLVNVNSTSSLPTFFVFGLLAGVSSCAALVGGMILALKIKNPLTFNLGRLISFGALGGILGLLGKQLQLSLGFTTFLVIIISGVMLLLGLQMLGVKIRIGLPKILGQKITSQDQLPVALGALTFFLPCGFTLTAQTAALLSGNPLQGSLIMLAFALGTLPALLVIGFTSKSISKSVSFAKAAGVLVIFFALYNLNSQFNRLGWPSLSNFGYRQSVKVSASDLPPIVNGRQIIKMSASSRGYTPSYFKIKVGIPVRWEITDNGTSGCTNAVIAPKLFSGQIDLTPGQTSVKEFTPSEAGRFKFSCWMGMVSGTMEVVDAQGQPVTTTGPDPVSANSGSGGCGCGGK